MRYLSGSPKGVAIYKVNACGTVATYACSRHSNTCVKESDDRRASDDR